MEKTKLIKPAVIAATTIGAAIVAPHIAPFLLFPLTSLIGEIFSQEELQKKDSIGKISVNAISGVLTNLASSAIWEAPDYFKSQQNEDLTRALAKAYQTSLEQLESKIRESDDDELKAQAEKILPLIKARVARALKTNTESALIELFPLQREGENSTQPVAEAFANRLSSEKFILELANETVTARQILTDEIEISARRWLNDELTAQSPTTILGLSRDEQLPEPLRSTVREKLSVAIPYYLGQALKETDLQNSWIAFQRAHLQAILKEVKNNQGLSAEDKNLLLPLAQKLDDLAKTPELIAEQTAEILRRSGESEENIKHFVHAQAVDIHKHLSGMEKRLSSQMDEMEKRLTDAVTSQKTEKGLPSNIPKAQGFVGRKEYLEDLRRWYADGKRCFVLHGMGGAGKTEIAKRFAGEILAEYDAHVFLDLQGASGNPLSPADAMWQIVSLFDEQMQRPQIPLSDPQTGRPLTVAEQSALELQVLQREYVSLLNKHNILLVLDNAKDETQIEPLNKINGDCLIVTARQRIYLNNCEAKDVEEMPPADAADLLERKLGKERFAGQTNNIANLCGYLPLALRAAEGVLFKKRSLSAEAYAKSLKENRLQLHNPERNTTVEAVIASSYDYLEPELQQFWRQLAVFPADFDSLAAAAVWNIETDKAEDVLADLDGYGLLKWNRATNRFKLHDLMREFTGKQLSGDERFQAQFLFSNYYASILIQGNKMQLNNEENYYSNVLKLFGIEWNHITAGQKWAAEFIEKDDRFAILCTDYASYARDFITLRLHPRQDIEWQEFGLKAARKLNNHQKEGLSLSNLGTAYSGLGEYRKAIDYHEQALEIFLEGAYRWGESTTLVSLGFSYDRLGEYQKAIDYYEQALEVSRKIDNHWGKSGSLSGLGDGYINLDEYQKAIEYYEQALEIYREIGDRQGEGISLGSLGIAYDRLGEHRKAIEFYEQYLVISREIDDRLGEGNSLSNLGIAYHNLGEREKACGLWKEALIILEAIESPNANDVRRWIEEDCGEYV
jgi:tetratricopeptide (TPR) repeat protein